MKLVKKRSRRWSLIVLGMVAFAGLAAAQTEAPQGNIEIVPVRGHIYLLAGAGANITLSVGPDGVFMVDAGLPQLTDKVLAAIRKLSQDIAKEGQPLASYAPPK